MNTPEPVCLILGGGGHARVLIDGLQAQGGARLMGVLDPDTSLRGQEIYGVPVLGGDGLLASLRERGASHFLVGLGGAADNQPRARVFARGLAAGLIPLTFIHAHAYVSPRASLGAGCQVLPQAVVNAGAWLGANVIVNSGALVEHDCRLGDHVHVASGARLCSAVQVGDLTHIGAGATVRQVVAIGERALVAAGAVVVAQVPAGGKVAGVPARAMAVRPQKPR